MQPHNDTKQTGMPLCVYHMHAATTHDSRVSHVAAHMGGVYENGTARDPNVPLEGVQGADQISAR